MFGSAKLTNYARSVYGLKRFHTKGFPLLPKGLWRFPLRNRAAYNEFIYWISKLQMKDSLTVFDVGTNRGDFTQAAIAACPNATIHMFEPHPALKPSIIEYARSCPQRLCFHDIALGSSNGKFPLHISNSEDAIGSLAGFGTLYQKVNPQDELSTVECDVRRLDDLMDELQLDKVDLLKIDVEGFEFHVLDGCGSKFAGITSIAVEVSLIRAGEAERNALVRMLSFLTEAGFQIVAIIPSLYDPLQPWMPVEFNVLARRGSRNA